MKKLFLIFSSLFLISRLGAYDKLDFKGIIKSSSFSRPESAAYCGGKTIVSDSKAGKLFIFEKGKLVRKVSDKILSPMGLACFGDRLYVTDRKDSKIKVYSLSGGFLWEFSGRGSLPGQLNKPRSAAVGPYGLVYVADTGNGRIEIFNGDGIFLRGFPTEAGGNRISPFYVRVDRALNIYVSGKKGGTIYKFSNAGKLLAKMPMKADSFFVDEYGFIYTVDAKKGKVGEYGPKGERLGVFGTRGRGKREFRELSDIFVSGNDIVLVDKGNRKIVRLSLENKLKKNKVKPVLLSSYFDISSPSPAFKYRPSAFALMKGGKMAAYLPESGDLVTAGKKGKKVIAGRGKEKGRVRDPEDIKYFGGKIYVADTGNDRISVFNEDGSFDSVFGEGGGFFGKGKEGKLNSPRGIAVNSDGRIYVADTGNSRIQAFNKDGFFLFAVGPETGGFSMEEPVSLTCDEEGNVYVLDAKLRKVFALEPSGKLIKVWNDSGKLRDPSRIVYDGKGYFYILDRGEYRIKVFDKKGDYVSGFFSKGEGGRELSEPLHMALRGGRIYLSDAGKKAVFSYKLRYVPAVPSKPSVEKKGKSVLVSFSGEKNGWISGYRVYRSEDEKDFSLLGDMKEGKYEDLKPASGATNYYAVSAVSESGDESALSQAAGIFLPEARKAAALAPSAGKNRAPVEIVPIDLGYIFSANYKYYMNHPIGRIAIVNNTDKNFENVKISFELKDFMDYPTNANVSSLPAKEKVEVELKGVLNNKVLGITEDTPVQAHLEAVYYVDGKEKKIDLNQPVKILSKNAIIWNNPKRLANFITPKDPPVFSFSRFVLKEKDGFKKASLLNEDLFTASLIWDALGEYGLSYLQDPVNPYAEIKSTSSPVLDTVQFPRETLKLKSGDCDDLTALFASLFEASGIRTALLDYPSHIALMFDTGANSAEQTGLPAKYLIKHEGTYWVGVETTLSGGGFLDAVKHQAAMFRNNRKTVRIIDVRKAWADFEPVTLNDTDFGKRPDIRKVKKRAEKTIAELLKLKYSYLTEKYEKILREKPGDAGALVNLGILNGEFGEYSKAEKYFRKILEKRPGDASALNNLGNIYFLGGKYEKAKEYYEKAAAIDGYDANIWLNLARASVKMGKKDDAGIYADKAVKLDSSLKAVAMKLVKD